ncbi:putative transmembrane protein [Paratrimastix pyriformis]|uniref:Transmembrane protein n=1 Tax=Paratrimastix pyriformis TaxID=342808 RepID=A0ABQ8UPH9_9EUKA|nr:putative transmembrane protein [Paratrimastix pyriformis]
MRRMPEIDVESAELAEVVAFEPKKRRFPLCLIWTTLPILSWLIPFIGHVEIAASDGKSQGFQGAYTVAVDNFAFNDPLAVVHLFSEKEIDCLRSKHPEDLKRIDGAIYRGSEDHRHQGWNLISNNCHSHAATCLNHMEYKEKKNWNMVSIWWLLMTRSKYLRPKWWCVIRTYTPFLVLVTLIVLAAVLPGLLWK